MRPEGVIETARERTGGTLDMEAEALVPDHEGGLERELGIDLEGP
jgi:hypothetical protein